MTEVEDVAVAVRRAVEDLGGGAFDRVPRRDADRGIEVALDRAVEADPLPGAVERDPPVHPDRVAAGVAHRRQELAGPHAEVDRGHREVLTSMRDAGGDAIGVDWRVPLDRAWERIGHDRAIQGNLDPSVCVASWDAVQRAATEVLDRAANRDGHVFNLGHGVLPATPVENLQRLVDLVHERTAR